MIWTPTCGLTKYAEFINGRAFAPPSTIPPCTLGSRFVVVSGAGVLDWYCYPPGILTTLISIAEK
jgi:hypothetical protein